MRGSITIPLVVALLSLSMIPLLSGSDGDIVIVFAGEIKDHQTRITINGTDEGVILNYSVEFTLISYYHTDITLKLMEHLGNITNSGSDSKWTNILSTREDRLYLSVEPLNILNNEVRCSYWININYSDVDGVNLTRELDISLLGNRPSTLLGMDWLNGYVAYEQWKKHSLSGITSTFEVFSNIDITVGYPTVNYSGAEQKSEYYYWKDVRYFNIDPLNCPNYYYYDPFRSPLDIRWGSGDNISEEKEYLDIYLSNKYWRYADRLIEREDVDISIDLAQGNLEYHIEAGFVINRTVYNNLNPYVWFPENGTECSAVFHFELPENGSEISMEAICEPGVMGNQKGFNIQMPYQLEGERIILDKDPVLNVSIKGTLTEPWFDFIIVTIPNENSSISITTPRLLDIEVGRNPFELIDRNYTFKNNILEFHGKCFQYGKLHLEWDYLLDSDGDLVPNIVDQLRFDGNETKDTDRDGFGDGKDRFPLDKNEWKDTDYDGWGDNRDAFPEDPLEWNDTDGDDWGDNIDQFLNDPSETIDTDGDGVGDNSDSYPTDPDKWEKEYEEKSNVSIIIITVIVIILIVSVVLFIIIKKKQNV